MEMRNIYVPEIAELTKVQPLSDLVSSLEIRLPGGKDLGHQAGQFVQVSLFGIGEAPISISSTPALHRMKAGEKIGIRGPFGKGFPLNEFEGKDIIVIAGGIGMFPLRSVIDSVIAESARKRYGRVIILYGAKSAEEILFPEERRLWESRKDIEYSVTVDRGSQGWTGKVGVITTLIPDLALDLGRTVAVVCGPPVMYKFAILALRSKGLRDEQIWVSLERKMKCGVGKCGHCQINNIYVCQEGPVFNYGKIKDLKEAI